MSIKTILLHMAHDAVRADRLSLAVDLAREHDAHLEVAVIAVPVITPAAIAGRAAAVGYIGDTREIAEKRTATVQAEVEEACNAAGISWNAQTLGEDEQKGLARLSHCADLLVVSEREGLIPEDYIGLHNPDAILTTASCPVLIVPREGRPARAGSRVLIAWKDNRESSRAVRDGMPFICNADKVYLLTGDPARHRFESGKQIMAFLQRHGVEAEAVSDVGNDHFGEVVLSYAKDLSVDLVVMGAYSTSRWREVLFGGATHEVLSGMTLPVLMSH
ncbi:universal stress protein [Inquilinus sp. CAU 1745]|uniref:universal stress protein n=1 Tax=Inquilinus sp. CAU 1745 TaxID=3140369 RepID=UPI00325BE4FA